VKKLSKKLGTPEKSKPLSPEMQRLEGVFKLMSSYGVGEVEIEDKTSRVHVRMGGTPSVSVSAPVAYAPPARETGLVSLKASVPSEAPLASNQKKILSPFVGTFYRASSPTAAPYAKEGQSVRKGQTICIIEAMKLMNQIESDFDGKIISALVENGQPVEFGEPLFIIEV